MFLFREGRIFEYNGPRGGYTQELLLDYLSSDNAVKLSILKHDNSDQFIKEVLGISGNFID